MKKGILLIFLGIAIIGIAANSLYSRHVKEQTNIQPAEVMGDGKILAGAFDKGKFKTDSQWKSVLTPEQYHILREQGTEIPFTGSLNHEKRKGTYYSAGCNEPVFRSDQKYDSKTGWPSFWAPISPKSVVLREDSLLPGEKRIEVLDICGNHLGHVFDDGPRPTGKRYCINSAALIFRPDKE